MRKIVHLVGHSHYVVEYLHFLSFFLSLFTKKNMYHFKCTELEVPDDGEGHKSLQNYGPTVLNHSDVTNLAARI